MENLRQPAIKQILELPTAKAITIWRASFLKILRLRSMPYTAGNP